MKKKIKSAVISIGIISVLLLSILIGVKNGTIDKLTKEMPTLETKQEQTNIQNENKATGWIFVFSEMPGEPAASQSDKISARLLYTAPKTGTINAVRKNWKRKEPYDAELLYSGCYLSSIFLSGLGG